MLNLQRKWFGLGSCWMLLWWHRHPQKKLVGGWTTQPKNMRKSNWIISPGIGVKIKNSWNHHLNNLDVFAACLFYHATFPPLSTPPLIWWLFWSLCKKHQKATLPETNIAMENGPFENVFPAKDGIFHCHASLQATSIHVIAFQYFVRLLSHIHTYPIILSLWQHIGSHHNRGHSD